MSLQYPETEERPEAAEGEASHEIGASLIDNASRARTLTAEHFIGKQASNGVVFDKEMFDAAAVYAEDATAVMRQTGVFGGPNFAIEKTITIPRVHEQSFGTPDFWLYCAGSRHVYLWDYKFGYEVVEAYENWQSLNYLPGILDLLGINGLTDQNLKITITIAQPRAYHRDGPIRKWTLTGGELRGYVNTLNQNAHEALGPNPICRSSKYCHHCSALSHCEAGLAGGVTLYEAASRPIGLNLSPQALGVQLAIIKRARKQLEYLESAYEEQAKSTVKSGTPVPGWTFQDAYGRERWAKPIPEVVDMGKRLEIDIQKPIEAITPVQARAAGIPDEVVRAYSETPRTGIKLVPDDPNRIKQVFEK